MYASLKRLYLELSLQEKRQLFLLTIVVVFTALLQVIGIASIFPFIAVALDPESIQSNQYLSVAMDFLEVKEHGFLIILGTFVLFIIILTNSSLAYSKWLTAKFLATMVHNLTYKTFQQYLHENYEFHLVKNSAELIKNLTVEVGRVINGGLMSSVNIMSGAISALFILILLIVVNPFVAISAILVLGGAYAMVYWSIKVKLGWVGIEVTDLMAKRMRFYNEALGGVKELTVLGREKLYIDKFLEVSEKIVKYKVYSASVMELPRYLIEIVSFGGVIAITIYLVGSQGDTQTALPMVALYGLAGYRLLPALQNIFRSFATLKHDISAVDLFYSDQSVNKQDVINEIKISHNNKGAKIFEKSIVMNDISYRYKGASRDAVKNLSLEIKANKSIGIVGTSGSGKSTLVDIMLGLLTPQHGEITVDDVTLTEGVLSDWRKNIGYVPQVIFLADATISENIAFGLPVHEIDQELVQRVSKIADLHEFIVTDLDGGYDAVIGERGVRLSGGQRQRIGIARALYHDPSVLILDEATSALDMPTEQSIINSVNKLVHSKTIIMIAHRLVTIKGCDIIIIMENGQIVDSGGYEELSNNSKSFRALLLKQSN